MGPLTALPRSRSAIGNLREYQMYRYLAAMTGQFGNTFSKSLPARRTLSGLGYAPYAVAGDRLETVDRQPRAKQVAAHTLRCDRSGDGGASLEDDKTVSFRRGDELGLEIMQQRRIGLDLSAVENLQVLRVVNDTQTRLAG